MTDPIADMITRIKNALMAGHTQAVIPHSKMKAAIGQLLVDHGYLTNMDIKDLKPQAEIVVDLKYVNKVPAITQVRRLSKPGRRMYASAKKVPRALGGYGLTIVSTSQGVMSDDDARKKNVGGELLCQIW